MLNRLFELHYLLFHNYFEIVKLALNTYRGFALKYASDELKNNLKCRSNRLNLIRIEESDFLDKINEINEEKKIV